MYAADFALAIINRRREWNHSYALCQWGLTTDGIKYSSTWLTSHAVPMEQTMWRHWGSKFMLIVGYGECTFPIGYIRRMNCRRNLNYSCLFKTRQNVENYQRNIRAPLVKEWSRPMKRSFKNLFEFTFKIKENLSMTASTLYVAQTSNIINYIIFFKVNFLLNRI